jgi:hypothetical protein
MIPKDPLDELLDRWNPEDPDPSGLQRDIWRRIADARIAASRPGFITQAGAWFRRPAFSLVFAAACALAGLAVLEWREARRQHQVNAELARQYLRVIDPMLGAPSGSDSMDRELAWMRDELRLTPVQYARIRALHETLNSQLVALEKERLRVRQETAALEEERRTEGQINFLVVAGLIKIRQELDLQSFHSMQQLVSATATIMTPEQRRRYLDYVQAAISTPPQPIAD